MAHREHNKPPHIAGSGFFLIILGALLFFIAPLFFAGEPEGVMLIVLGFVIGGIGFYRWHVFQKSGKRGS